MARKKSDVFEKEFRVPRRGSFQLKDVDPDYTGRVRSKEAARAALKEVHGHLSELQAVLYAQAKHAVLVVLQAMDTGGKDGTIRHVLGPLNPQGVRVTSFKAPTSEELAHDYLWRVHRATPAKGMIGVFNRSHYEDVLIARVHGLAPRKEIEKRYNQINAFEQHLAENGVTILKIHLCISKGEQKERLQSRLDRPHKNWKFSTGDLAERKLWNRYMKAYELALTRCNKPHAPWYVIPSNHKWFRDLAIARILLCTLKNLDLKYPAPEPHLEDIVIPD